MKILMLAPEPFFQPRGTPISVYFRLQALADLGHEVDLVTYHLGEDRSFPGLKIHRIPSLFFIKKIKIGPSFPKIPLDILLLFKAFVIFSSFHLNFLNSCIMFFHLRVFRKSRNKHCYKHSKKHNCRGQS